MIYDTTVIRMAAVQTRDFEDRLNEVVQDYQYENDASTGLRVEIQFVPEFSYLHALVIAYRDDTSLSEAL